MEHLAILVVYFLREDSDLPLLRLHLDRIAKHTRVPYTIYAAVNRATDQMREVLAAAPNVRICDIPDTKFRVSREHAYYLDALLARALADGASHIATLDVDSFPVRDDWVQRIVELAPESSGFAGVLRREDGDVELAHPSCIVATREFFERYRPTFSPDTDGTPQFRAFLRSTGQRSDTAIHCTYALNRQGLDWGRLLRTNIRNPHYLIAGIYADVVFHMEGTSRICLFRTDLANSRIHRLTRPLERYPVRGAAAKKAKAAILRRLRHTTEYRLAAENQVVSTALRSWLVADPDGLLTYLRGQTSGVEAAAWGLTTNP